MAVKAKNFNRYGFSGTTGMECELIVMLSRVRKRIHRIEEGQEQGRQVEVTLVAAAGGSGGGQAAADVWLV